MWNKTIRHRILAWPLKTIITADISETGIKWELNNNLLWKCIIIEEYMQGDIDVNKWLEKTLRNNELTIDIKKKEINNWIE